MNRNLIQKILLGLFLIASLIVGVRMFTFGSVNYSGTNTNNFALDELIEVENK